MWLVIWSKKAENGRVFSSEGVRKASLGKLYLRRWTATQDTACLGLVHGDDPERCYGEGGGRGFMFGNACTPMVDSCQCMAKSIQYCKVK